MKTYKQFQENVATSIFKSKPVQKLIGRTTAGRFARSFALPDTISGTKIPFTKFGVPKNKFTKALDIPYKAATDSIATGPAAPVTFATSLLGRSYGPTLSKLGKGIDKARNDTRKSVEKGLEKSGDKNSKFNANRYMSSFKNVDGKPLYPSSVPKI
tara:strand:- start:695 stop:1162 length:468 start_codon:yes stop_codon:yes gene_type:complete